MEAAVTALVCAGCGTRVPPEDPSPFRCPAARDGDDTDHVLQRVPSPGVTGFPSGEDPNPFVRYRELFHSYHVGRARGLSDEEYVSIVRTLDEGVASVDGRGFRVTPFEDEPALSTRAGFSSPGGIRVKDETGGVAGSHKGRHLIGLLLWFEVTERVGLGRRGGSRLAIASCGNAALAAAVLARAAERPLEVFVPTWADRTVVERLRELDADVTVCPRDEDVPGDPTYHRLRRAIESGAIPFTCQGVDNGLTIEGGLTIGYEIADALRRSGGELDRIVVQVGGGALASGLIQGLQEAESMGWIDGMPSIDTVQTEGAAPLARAYGLVVERVLDRIEAETGKAPESERHEDIAVFVRQLGGEPAIAAELSDVARHRSAFMWPWEEEPRSVADGIIDDETYDWFAVVRGMLATGGLPYVVSDELVREANALALETTDIDADHTGTAGLAGLLAARRGGTALSTDRAAVLFTGARRR
jgi:threonine dehydratase